MICDRFAFVIIYFALSGFKPSHSWAAEPNLLNTDILQNQTTLPQDVINVINYPHKTGSVVPEVLSQVKSAKPELVLPSSTVALKQQAKKLKESKEIRQLLPFGGMALISAIALFLISALFSKPQQKHKLSTINKNSQSEEASTESNAVASNLVQDHTLDLGLDMAKNNSGELEKSLVPDKVLLQEPPLVDIDADIDVIQELINDLQHPENYPHSDPESYPHKYDDLENLDSLAASPSPEISIRRKAIEKLAKVGDHRSIEALLNVMPQVEAFEKSSILQAISQINQRTFQPINNQLFITLGHENPEVRLNALRDLRNLYQFVSPVITEIAKMQSDQDYEIRTTATEILRQLNASPLPNFDHNSKRKVDSDSQVDDLTDDLTMGTESDNNLHLVAYLLAELDAGK
jgi:hypothetical protein